MVLGLLKRYKFDIVFTLLILCISIAVVLAQYPGHLLWGDSFVRWEFAKAITEHGIGFNYGSGGFQNWHSTFPTVLMAAALKASGSIGFFSFSQCFLLLGALYVACRIVVSPAASMLVTVLFLLFPVNLIFLVMHMPDALLPVFALLLAGVLSSRKLTTKKFNIFLYYSCVYLLFFICVWVRPNFAVTGVVVAYFSASRWRFKLANLVVLMACSVSMMGVWDRVLGVTVFDVSSVAMASEITGISKATDGKFCATCLDFVGNTQNARDHYKVGDVNPLLWDGDSGGLPSYKVGLKQNAQEIRSLWLSAIYSNPSEYLSLKVEQIALLLGVERGVKFMFLMRPIDAGRTELVCGCRVAEGSDLITKMATGAFGALSFFTERPYVQFIAGILSLLLLRGTKSFALALCCFSLAVVYYASFFIQMQRVEFRYFYPSWVLLWPVWTLSIMFVVCKFQVLNARGASMAK